MREMKIVAAPGKDKMPLVVRATTPRVFLSLGVFLEVVLLFCGSYLLADAILQPLDAGTVSVVGGGMFLGLATVLLFYLAWPGKGRSMSRRERRKALMLEIPANGNGEVVQPLTQSNWAAEKKEGLLRPM
jgi:hypothetical protein